jgi:predicted ATP-dependent protease
MKTGKTQSNGALQPEQVRRTCPNTWLDFKTTKELAPLHLGMAVQKRALDAINLGLGLQTRGYHVFVLGDPDSGKTTTLRILLTERAAREPTPPDLCYVHDFDTPDRPRPLTVPAGTGSKLAASLDGLVSDLQRTIPRTLTSDAFGIQRRAVMGSYQTQIEALREGLARDCHEMGFELRAEGGSFVPVPIKDGEPLDEAAFTALSPEERATYERLALSLRDKMMEHDWRLQRVERDMDAAVLEAEREAILPVVKAAISERKKAVGTLSDDVPAFFDRLGHHVVENHRRFLPPPIDDEEGEATGEQASAELFGEYRVNVVAMRPPGSGAPVVFERQPTQGRLLGCLEYREVKGGLKADHTSIRAGALHLGDGGYVVLQAADLAKRPTAWEGLKRALRDREVRIDEPEDDGRPRTAGAVRPQPTALGAKVILVGTPDAYYQFLIGDEEFTRLFKVKAEFEPTIAWNRGNVRRISRFLAQVAQQEGHLPLDRSAVARVVEFSSREARDQGRLSTRVAVLLDLVAEADFRARKARRRLITGEDVQAALRERRRRHGCDEDEILRTIQEGTLLVSTAGAVVGQINGLAVLETGDHAFGVTTRITARTWVGKSGVVNIDREVKLSGQIHDKGTLILIGLLGDRYARERPLAMSASITFEQSYETVEGDSASCAELLALLSSLADVPIKQGIAVTGSVNQQGEIQPVGGVSEKIEGMYRTCKLKGLTGDQGVVIPRRNMRHLMLDEDVLEAVGRGEFHIWVMDHIDEGIELLTGLPAGRRRADGSWQPGSINDLVDRRLAEMGARLSQLPMSHA